ncbi:MAG: cytochrome c, class I [Magnetococcales bacterium]|nr:cytochrome c, class I [Magnetococcales bacterium]
MTVNKGRIFAALAAMAIFSGALATVMSEKGEAHAAPATKQDAAPAAAPAAVNTFNRLLKGAGERNLPPTEDGIHDPANPGTALLQTPRDAFSTLSKSTGAMGNGVNWVEALKNNQINPRYDRLNPAEEAVVFDLDIVREVKGSMPNVVYPHDRHTMWLDCSNCHPDIFIPQKGANQISMAQIVMGEKCGVCHGKVAFPVGECRRCHSQNKDASGAPAAKAKK